jgi:hypothetical protein
MNKLIVISGVAVIEIVMAITLMPWIDRSHIRNTDFVNFYAAATIVRQGRGRDLYKGEIEAPIVESIVGRKVTGYFLHPPFEAAALVPLSYLPVERAFVVWTLLNSALLGLLPLILLGCVPFVARRPHLGLLGLLFPPALISLTLGQDSIIVLFVIAAAYLLCSKQLQFTGGLILALASIKFQFVLILALLLLSLRKFRLIAGLLLGCTFLTVISALVTGPRGLIEYSKYLRNFDLHDGYGNIHPELMVNLRGFLAAAMPLMNVRLYSTIGAVVFIGLGMMFSLRFHAQKTEALQFSLFAAISVVASPYTHFADATILLLPVFLAVDWCLSGRAIKVPEKLLAVSCALLFVEPIMLMIVAGHYWWNSRIYLMFPVIVLFMGSLGMTLYLNREPHPVAIGESGESSRSIV